MFSIPLSISQVTGDNLLCINMILLRFILPFFLIENEGYSEKKAPPHQKY